MLHRQPTPACPSKITAAWPAGRPIVAGWVETKTATFWSWAAPGGACSRGSPLGAGSSLCSLSPCSSSAWSSATWAATSTARLPLAAAAGPAASATASAAVGGYTLGQSGNQCSLQLGSGLQLGVQVRNGSSAPLTVGDIRTILPMGSLTVTGQRWGPCGELATSSDEADRYLPPGASTWFTVTVTVRARCPGPLPVQFMVGYDQNGKLEAVQLPGFADLGQAPYGNCPIH